MKSPVSTLSNRMRLLLALGALWVSGCASGPSFPPAPPTLPATLDYTYIIGPGDGLQVTVWRNPELSMSVSVRPDGKVSAPLVDELVAQGKTPQQLAREIEIALGKYVRDPRADCAAQRRSADRDAQSNLAQSTECRETDSHG